MWGFKIDMGTWIIVMLEIVYIISIIGFPLTRMNDNFGLKHPKCYESDEIWHRIHVKAAIVTIPFAVINFVFIFVNMMYVKIAVGIFLLIMLVISWYIVIKKESEK